VSTADAVDFSFSIAFAAAPDDAHALPPSTAISPSLVEGGLSDEALAQGPSLQRELLRSNVGVDASALRSPLPRLAETSPTRAANARPDVRPPSPPVAIPEREKQHAGSLDLECELQRMLTPVRAIST